MIDKNDSAVSLKTLRRLKITVMFILYAFISLSMLLSGCEYTSTLTTDRSEASDINTTILASMEKPDTLKEPNNLSSQNPTKVSNELTTAIASKEELAEQSDPDVPISSVTAEASTTTPSVILSANEATILPIGSEPVEKNSESPSVNENDNQVASSAKEGTNELDSTESKQPDSSGFTSANTDSPVQSIELSISSKEIRQGDLLAVWVRGIPSAFVDDKKVMIQASWLKNPIKAEIWGDYYIALIQATVSVQPNTYSVRAFYESTVGEDLEKQINEIESTKTLVKIVKRQFEQQIFSVSKELEEKRSAENVNNDAEKVAKAKSDGSTVPIWQKAFSMPIPNQAAKAFGKQRIINGKLNYTHSGVDISGKTGTHILAPAAGRVVFAGELVVAGNTVILDHGLGMYSSLVHMSKTGAVVGQLVQPGELVGYVGDTGFATGPHLHWTLTVHGNIVDPEYLIANDPLAEIR